jgi:AraC family transcriptional regulator
MASNLISLVTGANKGLGEAVARQFDRRAMTAMEDLGRCDTAHPANRRCQSYRNRDGGSEPLQVCRPYERTGLGANPPVVEISPREAVRRHTVTWRGMAGELIQAVTHDRIECRFNGPSHLLAVYERGWRHEGETFVQGAPRSTLRNFAGKLTFVPAGHEYHEWQTPRTLLRVFYFYLDATELLAPCGLDAEAMDLVPRVLFEDAILRDTASKLKTLIENRMSNSELYIEALGVVLAHEITRLNHGRPPIKPQDRGRLASWQERIIVSYIEEHLADPIPLVLLARLVRLSTFHFSRAFKQSFGMPPHRYHTMRRIEHAKVLLSKPAPSVSDVGLSVGFSQTSSFSTTFRRATGMTPTAYHRCLR